VKSLILIQVRGTQRIFAPGKSRRGLYRTVAPGEAPVS